MARDKVVRVVIFVIGILLFFSALSLLQYSQESTANLLYYDSWRIIEKLRLEAPVNAYFFHNTHTFTVSTAVLWLDTQMGSGNLSLLHNTVYIAQFVILGLFLCILRRRKGLGLGVLSTATSALLLMTLWFSMSNQATFSYPMSDVMAAACLLSILAFALLLGELLQDTTSRINRTLLILITVLVAALGFLSLETFIVVLLLGAFECCIRKKWSLLALLSFLILACLLFYFNHLSLSLGPRSAVSATNFTLVVSNSLKQLSGHIHYFFIAQKFGFNSAGYLAIAYSLAQLAIVLLSLKRIYSCRYDLRLHQRFAIYAISFAVDSIVSAVWLRFSTTHNLQPIPRYSWYATMFNLASLLLAFELATSGAKLVRFFAIAFIGINIVFIALDFGVAHPGEKTIKSRGEMAVYALSPGDETGLGPGGPGSGEVRGKVLRGIEYQYLSKNQLSVFSHEGLSFIGHPITPLARRDGRCEILKVDRSARYKNSVVNVELKGDFDIASGYFLLIGDDNLVKSFSFVGKPKYRDRKYTALFSVMNELESTNIIYLETHAKQYVMCSS
jgi:hypothetical protein